MKTIFITGVSTGIGYTAARELCANGYRVLGTVRKGSDGRRVESECGGNFHPILLDVASPAQIEKLPQTLNEQFGGLHLDGLINNAGIAKAAPAQFQPMQDVREQFEVNVLGLIGVTQVLLPYLAGSAGTAPGRIINISSVGGKLASPFLAAYAATKHAVEGFSQSLRRELIPSGIPVIIVGPGSIKSEIWNKSGSPGINPYETTQYRESFGKFMKVAREVEGEGFPPRAIGKFLVKLVEVRNPKVRYAFVPKPFKNWTVPMLLPDSWLDVVFGRMMGLKAG